MLCVCARACVCMQERRALFNLDVDIGGGQTKRIVVRRGDNVPTLAAEFVRENGLPESAQRRLTALLAQNIKLHKEKMQQKTRR